MIELNRTCARQRPLLVDFIDRGDVRPETAAALAHLDACRRCTEAIESTMLTITALRRIGADAAGIEPDPDAWPRLRVRIEVWHRRPAFMSPLAGVAMSVAIVAILVLPLRPGGSLLGPPATATFDGGSISGAAELRIERAYVAAVRHGGSAPPDAPSQISRKVSNYPRVYPDNDRVPLKEVTSEESTGPLPQAI